MLNLESLEDGMTAGWTDDRVGALKKLWLEGQSASQIAKQLGGGVTRNAVIGKVHRLGAHLPEAPHLAQIQGLHPDPVDPRIATRLRQAGRPGGDQIGRIGHGPPDALDRRASQEIRRDRPENDGAALTLTMIQYLVSVDRMIRTSCVS